MPADHKLRGPELTAANAACYPAAESGQQQARNTLYVPILFVPLRLASMHARPNFLARSEPLQPFRHLAGAANERRCLDLEDEIPRDLRGRTAAPSEALGISELRDSGSSPPLAASSLSLVPDSIVGVSCARSERGREKKRERQRERRRQTFTRRDPAKTFRASVISYSYLRLLNAAIIISPLQCPV